MGGTVWPGAAVLAFVVATAVPTSVPMGGAAVAGSDHRTLSARTTVAIIDTGVARIPGLRRAVWWRASRSYVPGEGLRDVNGHGTAVASIVHAAAPHARILAIKALEAPGGGSGGTIARAIRYATSAGARVINLSISGAAPLPRVLRALRVARRSGVLAVVAAGNDGLNINRYATYPASYHLANLVAVAAADEHGNLLPDSNFGRTVKHRAQGRAVPACSIDDRPILEEGTSAAAALISAQAARRAARSPGRSPERLGASLVFAVARPLPFPCGAPAAFPPPWG